MGYKNKEWKPHHKQEKFLSLPLTVKEGFFGGAAGGGKSDVLLMYPIAHGWHKNPNFKQVFMRRTYPELRNEIVPRSRGYYRPLGAEFNSQNMAWTFPSGAMIFLAACEHDDDVHKFDSMEINLYTPDELTSFTEWIYTYIAFQRVRTSDPSLPAIIRAAGMPGGIGHCVPSGDVLTPSGWIDIKEIKVGDPIYEVDDNFNLVLSQVEQKHVHQFDGELYKAHTTNLDILCTPDHRILRLLGKRGRDFNYTLTAAKDLPNQSNIRRTSNFNGQNPVNFELPFYSGLSRNKQPNSIPFELYAEFLGWYLSEGNLIDRDKAIHIAQLKLVNRFLLQECLDKCGFQYSETEQGFTIYSAAWWSYLSQFGKSRDKFIPRELLNSSKESLASLFISLMEGDGHWVDLGKSGRYFTISEKLANDFCELVVKLGYSAKLSSRQRENRSGLSYEIAFTSQECTEIIRDSKRNSNVSSENYNGLVYDVGVPKHHTFVIRQNGSVWISGNSWVYKRFIEPNEDGGKILIGKGGIKRIFIPSKYGDNPHIDKTYGQSLDALDDAERKAKKFGDWSAYQGSVFEEFRDYKLPDEPENALHVIKPFKIPDHWPRIVAIDWGYSAMTSIGFGAISPKRRLYIYRHLVFVRKKIEIWGPEVKYYIDEDMPEDIIICHSAAQHRGDPHTIQEQVSTALGRDVRLGIRDRIAGKMLLHEYLRWEQKSEVDGEAQVIEDNLPKLQLFDTPEIKLISNAIKTAQYAKSTKSGKKQEDVAEFDGDDPYDMLRMLLHAADDYFEDAEKAQKNLDQVQVVLDSYERTQDMTAFYRNMRKLESEQNSNKVIPISRRRRNYARFH